MKKSKIHSKVESFEKIINYTFQNKVLLKQALTHSSFANENKKNRGHNERLEFLGDAVLELVVSDYLYEEYADLPEGELTKLRATIVCESSLAEAARRLALGQHLYLGKGEELTGGRERESILCDAFEAVIGAIYIDGEMQQAKSYISNHLLQHLKQKKLHYQFTDHKTNLQEWIQRNSTSPIRYETIDEQGPDHNKCFVVQVLHKQQILGIGKGRSKKEAEQQAAWIAMQNIQSKDEKLKRN